MEIAPLSKVEFDKIRRLLHQIAGISLSPAKEALVSGRLAKRLQHYGLARYGDYLDLLVSGEAPAEMQLAIDLLTTNETYFFREPKHFERLRSLASAVRSSAQPFRVWSAASSTGEEAYSIAMVLTDCLGERAWEVIGSDISSRVLAHARRGQYSLERARHMPAGYLKRFCLKGMGTEDGTLLVARSLRSRVQFTSVNLNATLPRLGPFDVIFLRNVMIYFNEETKRQVVGRVLSLLRPGGHFFIGHSESLHGIIDEGLETLGPATYRLPAKEG